MADSGDRPLGQRRRWPFLFLLILAAVSLLLHAEKFRRGKNVLRLRTQYAALVRTRPIEETKVRRAQFYQCQYFLGYPVALSYAAADFVRRIHGIAPPLKLLAIQVDPGPQDLGFELTVGVAAASREAAQRPFAFFLASVRMLAGITEASFSPGKRSSGGMVSFVVNGRMELQP